MYKDRINYLEVFSVFFGQIGADLLMGAFHVVVNRLAEVVQEGGSPGDFMSIQRPQTKDEAVSAAYSDANAPLPTLDSTRLLARAALRRAVDATSA